MLHGARSCVSVQTMLVDHSGHDFHRGVNFIIEMQLHLVITKAKV